MISNKTARIAAIFGVSILLAGRAAAEENGTMNLMPSGSIAVAMTDAEMATKRGGFLGIAFSATFTATVENLNGNVTGTGTGTPVMPNGQPVTTTNQNGQVTLSTFVGNLSNVSGVFNIVQVPGSFNVVNSALTINVALVNMAPGAQVPTLSTIFR